VYPSGTDDANIVVSSLAYLSLSRHLEASFDPVKQISVLHLTASLPQTAPVKGLLHFSEYVTPQ